jgi:hypothetical protein
VKVVDDGALATGDGWAIARCEATDDLYFLVERSAASDEQTLHTAWKAAAQLVIEEAVRAGIVEWTRQSGEDA